MEVEPKVDRSCEDEDGDQVIQCWVLRAYGKRWTSTTIVDGWLRHWVLSRMGGLQRLKGMQT